MEVLDLQAPTAFMQAMDWQDLRWFHECARHGSLTAAAQALGMNATTVSRRISRLEAALNARLFDRDGARWTLTPVGQSTLDSSDRISAEAAKVQRAAFGEQDDLAGSLRVTSGGEFMRQFLAAVVWDFSRIYPMVQINLIDSTEFLRLDRHEADIAFRATDKLPEDAIAKQLAHMDFGIYYHRDKVDEVMVGTLPAVVFETRPENRPRWLERLPKPPNMVHVVNSDVLMLQAVELGAAVALLPRMLTASNPDLAAIDPKFTLRGPNIWMLYHTDVRSNRRLSAFRDFCEEKLRYLAETKSPWSAP